MLLYCDRISRTKPAIKNASTRGDVRNGPSPSMIGKERVELEVGPLDDVTTKLSWQWRVETGERMSGIWCLLQSISRGNEVGRVGICCLRLWEGAEPLHYSNYLFFLHFLVFPLCSSSILIGLSLRYINIQAFLFVFLAQFLVPYHIAFPTSESLIPHSDSSRVAAESLGFHIWLLNWS